jgi:hypothetical protein
MIRYRTAERDGLPVDQSIKEGSMKGSDKRQFRIRELLKVVTPGLVILALVLSLPAFARAAGDTGGDAKIQSMRSDIDACMQPGTAGQKAREAFAKKYNVPLGKISEKVPDRPPAGNGGWDSGTAQFVCLLEEVTGVGAIVWGQRRKLDKYIGDSELSYCWSYSMACDHYHWRQGCLKEHNKDCCN